MTTDTLIPVRFPRRSEGTTTFYDDLTTEYFKSLLNWAFKNIDVEEEDPEMRRAEFLACCEDTEKLIHFAYIQLDQCEPHFAYPWFRKEPFPGGLEQQIYLSLATALKAAKELGLELDTQATRGGHDQ